eukprot:XP_001610542.1 hypothetical protein [Babesia bovis T2Bo]
MLSQTTSGIQIDSNQAPFDTNDDDSDISNGLPVETHEASVDSMVEHAFSKESLPANLCIMVPHCREKLDFLSSTVQRLVNYTSEPRNAPHILYVLRRIKNIHGFGYRYDRFWDRLGSCNMLNSSCINIHPNSLMTIADVDTLFRVYSILNTSDLSDPCAVISRIRQSFANRLNCNPKMDFMLSNDEVTDENASVFLGILKPLLDSFFIPHSDLPSRTYLDDDIPLQKESLLSQLHWQRSSYLSPDLAASRLMLDEPQKRICIMDGFVLNGIQDDLEWNGGTFDFLVTTLRPGCQVIALSPKVFNPQNLAQWLRRYVGPMQFVMGRKFPEVRVFYNGYNFDPFDSMQPFRYAKTALDTLEKTLSGSSGSLQQLFQSDITNLSPTNYPFNPQFELMAKSIMKDLLAKAGIDTLRKLTHFSRGVYDYAKRYLPGKSLHNPDLCPAGVDTGDKMTIEAFVDQLIDLKSNHLGSKLVRLLNLDHVINSDLSNHVSQVINRVIEDGIYPAVICCPKTQPFGIYRRLFMEMLPVMPHVDNDITALFGHSDMALFRRGVAVVTTNTHPDIASYVYSNVEQFKIVLTSSAIYGGKHYVYHFPSYNEISPLWARRRALSLGNTVSGAERVSIFALPHTYVLHLLRYMLGPLMLDFHWLSPGVSMDRYRKSLGSEPTATPELIQSLDRSSFMRFMDDHGRKYTETPLGTPMGNYMDYRSESQVPIAYQREIGVSDHSESPRQLHRSEPGVYRAADLKVPRARNMLERHVHLESMEGALREAGVDIEEFYRLDRKKKYEDKFIEYLRSRIYSTLLYKQKDVHIVYKTLGLSGARILGIDGAEYTLVWMGRDNNIFVPTITIGNRVKDTISRFCEDNKHNEFFVILKDQNSYIFTPAMFIKDIVSLPKADRLHHEVMLWSSRGATSIRMAPGTPVGALPDKLDYMCLGPDESSLRKLPGTIDSRAILPPDLSKMVDRAVDMQRNSCLAESEMMAMAIDKILATPRIGAKTPQEAYKLLISTREMYRNRALGGLERYLSDREGVSRVWGRRPGSVSQSVGSLKLGFDPRNTGGTTSV